MSKKSFNNLFNFFILFYLNKNGEDDTKILKDKSKNNNNYYFN